MHARARGHGEERPAIQAAISAPTFGARVLDAAARAAAPLVLVVAALLFAQWPLREVIGRGAIQTNDAAQLLFALYVAVAVVHAGRRHMHLCARTDIDVDASFWRRIGARLAVVTWSGFVLVTAGPSIVRSLAQLERFPESGTPGYFGVKLALAVMAVLLLVACTIGRPREP